jgi:hypothetical protein
MVPELRNSGTTILIQISNSGTTQISNSGTSQNIVVPEFVMDGSGVAQLRNHFSKTSKLVETFCQKSWFRSLLTPEPRGSNSKNEQISYYICAIVKNLSNALMLALRTKIFQKIKKVFLTKLSKFKTN